MRTQVFGPVVVAIFTFVFGWMLFRGMVLEWHRRASEQPGHSASSGT